MTVKANILVVDDEKNIREGLRISLSREGHVVLTAGDGLEAIKVLKKEEIDVVITDLKMPNMDGETLMQTILKDFFS